MLKNLLKMIVLMLVIMCVLVRGQNNNYRVDADAVIFPGPVNSPRILSRPESRPTAKSHVDNQVILQKSLLLARELNKLESIDDFLNMVVGIPETEKSFLLSSRMGGERSSATRPKPAKCQPELRTVSLLPEKHDPSVIYMPSCTRMKRCGGCCNHSLLSCQPTVVEDRNFEVFVSIVDKDGILNFKERKIVAMEEHVACDCQCAIRPEHCSKSQFYEESECKCVCKNRDEEEKCKHYHGVKLWDPEICSCSCIKQLECGSGLFFNQNTCSCEKRGTSSLFYDNDKTAGLPPWQIGNFDQPIIIALNTSDPRRRHKDEP